MKINPCRLRGAIVGIDGENNSLFTITVDGKMFHLQVSNSYNNRETQHWVERNNLQKWP